MKARRVTLCTGIVAASLALTIAGQAAGANESVSVRTAMSPIGAATFKELRVPMRSRIRATVTVPPGQPQVLPMKQIRIRFDRDMTFNPNNRVTPVCPERRINPTVNLAIGISFMVDRCPRSVVGTGHASIYLAKLVSGRLDDPELVIFNAGRNRTGEPRIKIYGYSKGTGTGVLMYGTLGRNGVMTVAIPVLSFDSAVGQFVLDIPGGMQAEDAREPDRTRFIRGGDPRYVRARCSGRAWRSGATFWLGERDPATGAPTGPTSVIGAPSFIQSCHGRAGRPRLVRVRQRFPAVAARGSRPVFRVWVRNRGTASARNVRLIARGGIRGRRRVALIPPGATRTLWIRPRVIGRPGTRPRVVVRVNARGSAVGFANRIRVRRR